MGLVGNYPGVPFFDIRGIRVLVFARLVLLFTIKKDFVLDVSTPFDKWFRFW